MRNVKSELKKSECTVWLHHDHLDLAIDCDKLPFDVVGGERLLCRVKDNKKLGTRLSGNVELFITKEDNTWRL